MKSFAPILAMLLLVSSASAHTGTGKAYDGNNNAVAITEAEEVSYMSLCHSEGAYLAHMGTHNIIRDWNYSTRTSLLKSRRRITKRVVVKRIRRVAVTR